MRVLTIFKGSLICSSVFFFLFDFSIKLFSLFQIEVTLSNMCNGGFHALCLPSLFSFCALLIGNLVHYAPKIHWPLIFIYIICMRILFSSLSLSLQTADQLTSKYKLIPGSSFSFQTYATIRVTQTKFFLGSGDWSDVQ